VKGLDRHLQTRRIRAALPWIPPRAHVLDVGCADGALFRLGQARISSGVGIDIRPNRVWAGDGYERRVGTFPEAVRPDERFDAVVMLAVVEHVPNEELARWAAAAPRMLRPDGRVVITTPSPMVDHILDVGIRLRVIAGMEADEHHGFDPGEVPGIFSVPGLRLERRARFELGLNHLFVFAATATATAP
jgi:2-polyprenyl-3-methyl-5-hydroxy-6-metoxy-1,4-benzoquinol methylase